MFASSPPKSIAKSIRDSRMFHSVEEISGYRENSLRYLSKTVMHCCTVLSAAVMLPDNAQYVISCFGSFEQKDVREVLMNAKSCINRGEWNVFRHLEGRPDVVSILLLDWLWTRTDTVLEIPTLFAICNAFREKSSDLLKQEEVFRELIDLFLPLESRFSSQDASTLSEVLTSTMQKPQLYLLEHIVRLLCIMCTSIGIQDVYKLSDHEHGSLFLQRVIAVSVAMAPCRDSLSSVQYYEYDQHILSSIEKLILYAERNDDTYNDSGAVVACILLVLVSEKFTLPQARSPVKAILNKGIA